MEKSEFLKQEYISLREEIVHTKARLFRTLSFGIIIVPAANLLAQFYELDTLILALPILVIVVSILYLSENNALMRCGIYIKEVIEVESKMQGWEHWLENTKTCDARNVDKFLSYSFYLLYFVYFVGAVFVASQFALEKYNYIFGSVVIGAYVSIGVWFLIFLVKNIKTSTTVRHKNN